MKYHGTNFIGMKIYQVALTAFVVSLLSPALAQDYTFKVLVNKGKNEMKTQSGWQQMKVGSSLRQADEIKIVENAYLGLVHVSGKALEVKQSGNYKVMELAARVNGGTSVLNKYTDFILSANMAPKNTLTATGAVNRGVDNIPVFLPRPELSVVFNDKVTINWEDDKSLRPYEVVFKSMFGDELNTIETSENRVEIDLTDRNFEDEDNILVTVRSKNQSKVSNDYTLKKLSRADKDRIRALFREIAVQTSDPTALNKFVIAGFYEDNNLLIDAISAYQEAIKLAPDVPAFSDAYNDFLLRHAIKTLPNKK
jgi:hypothetical protein